MTQESQDSRLDEPDKSIAESRRGFIRKAVYSAPVLFTLGSLSHIQSAAAQDGSEPPCQPGFDC